MMPSRELLQQAAAEVNRWKEVLHDVRDELTKRYLRPTCK